ncbi:uncharacterized protein LOC144332960 isoform X4 [Macaca mulatta]
MATYPPRRLLGARPLPSDRRRDPRRSGFPPGGGGRWERRLQSSSDGGGLLLLRGRYRERGFCGRCRFPGARLLRRGLWPQVRGGPQGPGAMNAPATSGACARTSGTGTTSPSPSE